jgi:hypothetical protein
VILQKPEVGFDIVYSRLVVILKKYARGSLKATSDTDGRFVVLGPPRTGPSER